MITYYIVILRQLETLCIGLCFLCIRCFFTGEDIKEVYPDSLKHWGWYYYFFTLWFVILPYFIMKYDLPHHGIWGMLYNIHPWLCWIALMIQLSFSAYIIYIRYYRVKF